MKILKIYAVHICRKTILGILPFFLFFEHISYRWCYGARTHAIAVFVLGMWMSVILDREKHASTVIFPQSNFAINMKKS